MPAYNLYRTNADTILGNSLTNFCLIIDLDQTFIATQAPGADLKKLGILTNPKYYDLRFRIYTLNIDDIEGPGYGSKYAMWGIFRPGSKEFLTWAKSYFAIIAVWSAGTRHYVEIITDKLFKDLPPPDLIFTRDDIESDPEDKVFKPITKMMKEFNGRMTLENTFILDDNERTFKKNVDNGILIPAYEPIDTIEELYTDDNELAKFKTWLLRPEVMNSSDVRKLRKDNIFY